MDSTFCFALQRLAPDNRCDDGLPAQGPLLHSYFGDQSNLPIRWLSKPALQLDPYQSPVVLCGDSGTGKTAIAETILQRHLQNQRVYMLSADEFRRRFLTALDTGTVSCFREELRRHDLVCIDRLETLDKSERTQLELLDLIDHCDRSDKTIVITIDQLPVLCDYLLPQLASRLNGGLLVKLEKPGSTARKQIVSELLTALGKPVGDRVSELVTDKLADHTVVEICSVVKTLAEFAGNDSCSVEKVEQFFSRHHTGGSLSIPQIAKLVSRHFDVKLSDMRGNTRRQIVVDARAVAFYLVRKLLAISYKEIGEYFGNRDHSTVRHSLLQIKNRINSDPLFSSQLDLLIEQLSVGKIC